MLSTVTRHQRARKGSVSCRPVALVIRACVVLILLVRALPAVVRWGSCCRSAGENACTSQTTSIAVGIPYVPPCTTRLPYLILRVLLGSLASIPGSHAPFYKTSPPAVSMYALGFMCVYLYPHTSMSRWCKMMIGVLSASSV